MPTLTYLTTLLLLSLSPTPAQSQSQAQALTVNLTYALYKSTFSPSTNLNVWKGIRYAAPPIGPLRWQKTAPPLVNLTQVVVANTPAPICPQAMPAIQGMPFVQGDEDCLFLSVWSGWRGAEGEKLLPVVVVIHGGGYGAGDGSQDMSGFLATNGNGVVTVVVQYRVSFFLFLSREVGVVW